MFLMSEAFRQLAAAPGGQPFCDWRSTSVLFLSHDWGVSSDSAEALAGRRLVDALVGAGARVHVIAGGPLPDEPAGEGYTVTAVAPLPFPSNKLHRAMRMVGSTIPEAEGAWVPRAVEAGLDALAAMPADTVIYGRAMPGSSNIAAWRLARITGHPWIAHFSDPWPPHHVLARGRRWLAPYKPPLYTLWRRRIVRDAGALTLTSPGYINDYLGTEGAPYVGKTFVVTHLPSRWPVSHRPPQFERFHIVHTGNFYPVDHTWATVLQGVRLFLDRTPEAIGRVRVTQAGWSDGDIGVWTERCRLQEVVRVTGRLSQTDVCLLLSEASLLLAVDYARPDSRAILSKIPDYVAARRPILAITAPGSSLGRLFDEDGAGLRAGYDSPEEVAQRLATVFAVWTARHFESLLPHSDAVAAFTPERVLSELSGAVAVARASRRHGAAERGMAAEIAFRPSAPADVHVPRRVAPRFAGNGEGD